MATKTKYVCHTNNVFNKSSKVNIKIQIISIWITEQTHSVCQGFSTSSPWTFGLEILWVGVGVGCCPIHYKMFISILRLFPLDVSSNLLPPPAYDNQYCPQAQPDIHWRASSPLMRTTVTYRQPLCFLRKH